jgi:hypothetical protein
MRVTGTYILYAPTRGQSTERGYAAIEIVDDDALLDRIVYTVTNPAAAKADKNSKRGRRQEGREPWAPWKGLV